MKMLQALLLTKTTCFCISFTVLSFLILMFTICVCNFVCAFVCMRVCVRACMYFHESNNTYIWKETRIYDCLLVSGFLCHVQHPCLCTQIIGYNTFWTVLDQPKSCEALGRKSAMLLFSLYVWYVDAFQLSLKI